MLLGNLDGKVIEWEGQKLKLHVPEKFHSRHYDDMTPDALHPDICDWWEPV